MADDSNLRLSSPSVAILDGVESTLTSDPQPLSAPFRLDERAECFDAVFLRVFPYAVFDVFSVCFLESFSRHVFCECCHMVLSLFLVISGNIMNIFSK